MCDRLSHCLLFITTHNLFGIGMKNISSPSVDCKTYLQDRTFFPECFTNSCLLSFPAATNGCSSISRKLQLMLQVPFFTPESGAHCSSLSVKFFCGVEWKAKFKNERWMHETNCSPALWTLLPAYTKVKINSTNNTRSSHTSCKVHWSSRDFRIFIVYCNKFVFSV
jgi:hypothetical protein